MFVRLISKIFRFSPVRSFYKRQSFIIDFLLNCEKGTKLLDIGAGEQQYKIYAKHLP